MAVPQTVTFKKVGPLSIKLDIYLPRTPATNVPVLLWYHGGGLLQGSRIDIAPHTVASAQKYGYVVISADYRFAPQVAVQEIFGDTLDCMSWIVDELPNHIAASGVTVDTSRIAVSGSSAGGYLALLIGLYSKIRPKVVLPIYPITDPLGEFFTTPQPVTKGSRLDEAAIVPFLDPDADPISENDLSAARQTMYDYMLKSANLASLWRVKHGDSTYIITDQLRQRNSFPPTFVVHGEADTFVGVEQSDELVRVLKHIGATHEYERLPGTEHLFDYDEDVQMHSYYAFLSKYI
ncbi:hypothetical protein AYL99_03813 [Fonsecaea erecta]|uniref:BD-FAE-like domain-containing protein n=1 Tax=Fonsecaea erecta TaxID=1367422 RepID=A0A178ZP75_9EURO|nr:hypothetical protein AYL99_03813 [Fonsecaea erecta]OAP61610.1 hypothetical protein AYL99_03813 [Fonsecaea erecta]